MCIAIYKPAGAEISEETLKVCHENNDDGCGFAYINEDNLGVRKIIIKKTMDFEVFLKQYRRAQEIAPESPFLIHFRIATHGTVNKFNCHPFMVDNETVFVHNGVIRNVPSDTKKSDTQMFNKKILRNLESHKLVYDPTTRLLVEAFISTGSKLIFMNIDGDIQIYNESAGNWEGDVWYSNTSWKPKPVYNSYKSYSYGSHYNTQYGAGKSTVGSRRVFDYSERTPYYKASNSSSTRSESSVAEAYHAKNKYYKCSGCGIYHSGSSMNAYRDGSEMKCYCPRCEDIRLTTEKIIEFDFISMEHYADYFNEVNP